MAQKYSLTRRASLPGIVNYETLNDLPLANVTPGRLAWVNEVQQLYLFDVAWQTIDTNNLPPSFEGVPTSLTLPVNQLYSLDLASLITDPEGLPVSITFQETSTDPDTLIEIDTSQQLNITPGFIAETFNVTLTVSDGLEEADHVITITTLNTPPSIVTIPTQYPTYANRYTPYEVTLEFTDIDSTDERPDEVTWSVVSTSVINASNCSIANNNILQVLVDVFYQNFSVTVQAAQYGATTQTTINFFATGEPQAVLFDTPGSYTWTAPEGVTEVNALAIGGGTRGFNSGKNAGAGGGLGWRNGIPVTPGQSYAVVVGAAGGTNQNGGDSYFVDTLTVWGQGGQDITGGTFFGDGGGNGGAGVATSDYNERGGGGAGGYSGKGGDGRLGAGQDGAGGGGGGGGTNASGYGGNGGGTGVYGEGLSGRGGIYNGDIHGAGGSGGLSGSQPGLYGGGGAGGGSGGAVGTGGHGAVRLLYGEGLTWPNNAVVPGDIMVNATWDFPEITATEVLQSGGSLITSDNLTTNGAPYWANQGNTLVQTDPNITYGYTLLRDANAVGTADNGDYGYVRAGLTQRFTISFWSKASSSDSLNSLSGGFATYPVPEAINGGWSAGFYFNGEGFTIIYYQGENRFPKQNTAFKVIKDDQWHHYAITKGDSDNFRFWTDGNLTSAWSSAINTSLIPAGYNLVTMGLGGPPPEIPGFFFGHQSWDPFNYPPAGNSCAYDDLTIRLNTELYTQEFTPPLKSSNNAPIITSGSLSEYILNTDGTATTITLQAYDPEDSALTWSYAVTDGSVGSTAVISQTDNVFTITPGTLVADEGTFELTFSVTDGENISSTISRFTLYIDPTWDTTTFTDSYFQLDPRNGILYDYDRLGRDVVRVSENYTASTAPFGEAGTGTVNKGSVHILSRSDENTWTYRQTIEVANTNASEWGNGLAFGKTDDSYLYILSGGLSGYAGIYCYQTIDNGVTWNQVATGSFIISDLGSNLGGSLELTQDDLTLFVGDPTFNDGRGRVLVYTRTTSDPAASPWSLSQTLEPSISPPRNAYFGRRMQLDGISLIIGSYNDGRTANFGGSAYIFGLNEGSWIEVQRITRNVVNHNEGIDVAIANELAATGATSFGNLNGAINIYNYNGTQWVYLTTINGDQDAELGRAVDLTYNAQNNIYHLFAGSPGTSNVKIYESINDGVTWTSIFDLTLAATRLGSALHVYEKWLSVGMPEADFAGSPEVGALRWIYSDEP